MTVTDPSGPSKAADEAAFAQAQAAGEADFEARQQQSARLMG